MTKLQHLPEEVLNLWNKWEIRGMVLLSLSLQIILIIFGSRRETIARSWIRILVWSAYLSADMVATVALGNLARSQGISSCDGSAKANSSIQAFWAPFLLLHLGGPDTITAYSIEDNELWLRHFLGLAFQVSVAFYIFSRSWGSNFLTFIAIPLFIVGIMKYAERTWVLNYSCSKHMKESFLSIGRLSSVKGVPESFWDREGSYRFRQDWEGSYLLRQAYFLFHISMFTMQDLLPGTSLLSDSQSIISANSAEDAFKIVEIELGLIYDRLYTKAPLIYSRMGIILRSISFLLSSSAFVTFAVMINKHAYSTIDITITYLLLIGALVLEIYAFLCLVFSDRTLIWLSTDTGGNIPASCVHPVIFSLIGKSTTNKKWSRSMAQHNLINSCIEDRPIKCLELFGIHETMKQMYMIREDMNVELQGFIFEHLQRKGEMIKVDFNFIETKFRIKVIGQRGDGVLERMQQLEHFRWCTTEVDFSHSILVWHLATDICFYSDEMNIKEDSSERETSKWLSEYMMYLLVNRPNMLPQGIGDLGYSYRHTCEDLMDMYLRSIRSKSKKDLVNYVLKKKSHIEPPSVPGRNKSALFDGCKLAKQILKPSLEFEKPWKMINEVWIEMLAYAAAHCPWKEHAQQLTKGGELLTHVSFLMLHFGLSQQYQLNRDDFGRHLDQLKNNKEEEDKFLQALRRERRWDENKTEEETWQDLRMKNRRDEELRKRGKHIFATPGPQELLPGERTEGPAQSSGGQGLVLHEIEEVPQPIGIKYLQLSSYNARLKEVEELKKVVADKDRELEHKDRELVRKDRELEYKKKEIVQMKSLLDALTPQQGLGALPGGLSARNDDQGTNQPPSK